MSTGLCKYGKGKCKNVRTTKMNGESHTLCFYHKQKGCKNQLKLDRKRRSESSQVKIKVRLTPSAPATPMHFSPVPLVNSHFEEQATQSSQDQLMGSFHLTKNEAHQRSPPLAPPPELNISPMNSPQPTQPVHGESHTLSPRNQNKVCKKQIKVDRKSRIESLQKKKFCEKVTVKNDVLPAPALASAKLCQYGYGLCKYVQTTEKNGKNYTFCADHQQKRCTNQRKSQKRRIECSTEKQARQRLTPAVAPAEFQYLSVFPLVNSHVEELATQSSIQGQNMGGINLEELQESVHDIQFSFLADDDWFQRYSQSLYISSNFNDIEIEALQHYIL